VELSRLRPTDGESLRDIEVWIHGEVGEKEEEGHYGAPQEKKNLRDRLSLPAERNEIRSIIALIIEGESLPNWGNFGLP